MLAAAAAAEAETVRHCPEPNSNPETMETPAHKEIVPLPGGREAATVALNAFLLMAALDFTKKKVPVLDVGKQFQVLARHQAVAMMFAHTDAFVADTLRVVCRVKPEVLRTGKQLTWETALSYPSMDDLLSGLVEEFSYEFGWKTLRHRLEFFHDRFGVDLDIPPDELNLLKTFEQRRHLIIHNGGVVTEKYIAETGDANTRVGRPIVVSRADVRTLGNTVSLLGGELFCAIAVKYLAAKPSDLTQVLHR